MGSSGSDFCSAYQWGVLIFGYLDCSSIDRYVCDLGISVFDFMYLLVYCISGLYYEGDVAVYPEKEFRVYTLNFEFSALLQDMLVKNRFLRVLIKR